jgi:hypothetical protein
VLLVYGVLSVVALLVMELGWAGIGLLAINLAGFVVYAVRRD